MKDTIKIFSLALPFAFLASISLPFFNQLGGGFWLIEQLSIQGYWPVNIVFYIEYFFSAVLTTLIYAAAIIFLVPRYRYLNTLTAILAYALFTFLLCFRQEHLTACLFTLLQGTHIAVYIAIFLLLEGAERIKPRL